MHLITGAKRSRLETSKVQISLTQSDSSGDENCSLGRTVKKMKCSSIKPKANNYLHVRDCMDNDPRRSSFDDANGVLIPGSDLTIENATTDLTEDEKDAIYFARKELFLRTLKIEYWSRSEECKQRKWDHLEQLDDAENLSREQHILNTTLKGRQTVLEPNMFPYDTPSDIDHWTLWSLNDMSHEQIEEYVYAWLRRQPYRIVCWNYDDNPERSIDLFHVHVYFQRLQEDPVQSPAAVEDFDSNPEKA